MRLQDIPVSLHNDKRGLITVEEGRLDILQLSKDGRPPKRLLTSPIRNVLLARLAATKTAGERRRLDIHALIAGRKGLHLSKMHVLVDPINVPEAEEWVQTAMSAAYPGSTPQRRLLVLVNPIGGKGKGRQILKDEVLPILEAAGCAVSVMETKHNGHAEEIAHAMKLDYDAIAVLGGDGTTYEVLNGLASRADARKALRIPIAPVPTGSACAICTNLFGVKDTFNIPLACLNAIKGQPLPVDLCSVLMLPSGNRRWSFLSISLGLMVDLDIGTENLRWMGDTRFVYGFLRGLINMNNCKCRLRIQVTNSDKIEMAKKAREHVRSLPGAAKAMGGGHDPLPSLSSKRMIGADKSQSDATGGATAGPGTATPAESQTVDSTSGGQGSDAEDGAISLPLAAPLSPDSSWLTIDSTHKHSSRRHSKISDTPEAIQNQRAKEWVDGDRVLWVSAGLQPYISRDFNQFPVATGGEGVMDVVVQSIVSRGTLVSAINGAEKGEQFWMDCQHYYKAKALVVENLDKKNQPIFTIDGEPFEFDSFHVEVHERIANVMSLDGRLFVSEFLTKHDGQ